MLCWADLPDGVTPDVLRRETRLVNLVGWKHLARKLNVATTEEVGAAFRGMGYVVHEETRAWRNAMIRVSVPCVPMVPAMKAT